VVDGLTSGGLSPRFQGRLRGQRSSRPGGGLVAAPLA
jgi:hypothetical protein